MDLQDPTASLGSKREGEKYSGRSFLELKVDLTDGLITMEVLIKGHYVFLTFCVTLSPAFFDTALFSP